MMGLRGQASSGCVVWMSGLSGAGKTTLANALIKELERRSMNAEHLDGDALRAQNRDGDFSRTGRLNHLKRAADLAADGERAGKIVIASLITPFEEARSYVRQVCKNLIEVYVSTSLAICEKRDPKGLYAQARAGKIREMTGIDSTFDVPSKSDLTIDTAVISIEEGVALLLAAIQKKMTEPVCRICGDHRSISIASTAEDSIYDEMLMRSSNKSEWRFCKGCGFLYRFPQRSGMELGALYKESIYNNPEHPLVKSHQSFDQKRYHFEWKMDSVEKNSVGMQTHWDRIRSAFPEIEKDSQSKRFIDVGCGQGGALVYFSRLGWKIDGVEPDPRYCRFIEQSFGFQVRNEVFEEASFSPDDRYDLVFSKEAWHFLADPFAAIQKIYSLLRPSGVLYIAVHTVEMNGNPSGPAGRTHFMSFHANHAWDSHTLKAALAKAGFGRFRVWNSGYGTMAIVAQKLETGASEAKESSELKRCWWIPFLRVRYFGVYRAFWRILRGLKDRISAK